MIAVSDAVLILVSAVALGSGLYRWQNNVEQASLDNSRPAVSIQAGAQNNVANSPQNQPVNGTASTPGASAGDQGNPVQPGTVVVADPVPAATINAAQDNATAASNNAVVDARPYGSHIVRSGDSLSLIAEQYDTTVRALQEVNQLENTIIRVGQELRYPLPAN